MESTFPVASIFPSCKFCLHLIGKGFSEESFVSVCGFRVSPPRTGGAEGTGAFMAFAIIKFNPGRFRAEIVNVDERNYRLGPWWEVVINYVVPIEVITLLVWWICQSVFVESWYNPFSTFSLATIAVQWGVAMELFLVYNRRIADKTEANF